MITAETLVEAGALPGYAPLLLLLPLLGFAFTAAAMASFRETFASAAKSRTSSSMRPPLRPPPCAWRTHAEPINNATKKVMHRVMVVLLAIAVGIAVTVSPTTSTALAAVTVALVHLVVGAGATDGARRCLVAADGGAK